jgi:cell fate regulator YaaT (PSP1 superfamily)
VSDRRPPGRPTAARPSGPPKRRLPVNTIDAPASDERWGAGLVRVVHARVGENARVTLEAKRGVFVPGTVVAFRGPHGAGTARTLGYPTLTLDPPRIDGVVVGVATEADRAKESKLRERESSVAAAGRAALREVGVAAKAVRAEAEEGGHRFVLLLATDERVDFRTVLRAIGQRTRERVELRIIGDRDAAKILGGVGPCGLQLCCNTFLQTFEPVGMRMAREQGLAMHPERVNGVCGRLLCCLVYEDAAYRAARALVPKLGERVTVEGATWEVVGVDVLEGRVRLRNAQGIERTVPVSALPQAPPPPEAPGAAEPSEKSPR